MVNYLDVGTLFKEVFLCHPALLHDPSSSLRPLIPSSKVQVLIMA